MSPAGTTSAYADIACRYVRVSADVSVELGHEALAESHNFSVGFALGIEVGAALAAADGKAGQGVLEDLPKPRNLMMPRFTEGWKRRPPL